MQILKKILDKVKDIKKENRRKPHEFTDEEIEERKKALEEAGTGIDYRSIEEDDPTLENQK